MAWANSESLALMPLVQPLRIASFRDRLPCPPSEMRNVFAGSQFAPDHRRPLRGGGLVGSGRGWSKGPSHHRPRNDATAPSPSKDSVAAILWLSCQM